MTKSSASPHPLLLASLLLLFTSTKASHFNSPAILRSVRRPCQVSRNSVSGPNLFVAPTDDYWSTSTGSDDEDDDMFFDDGKKLNHVQSCSATSIAGVPPINPVIKNLLRGAFLRVASDLSGGTPLENIKTRVTATTDGPIKAYQHIVNRDENGIFNLWSGSPSRTVEGSLLGAVFMVASVATKKQVLNLGGGTATAALAAGIVGGVAQAVIMTPAGLVFTSLNLNRGKPGFENDNSLTVAKRIVDEKGFQGMFIGGGPMAVRQASNWASRSVFTEICRSNLGLGRYGIVGEIASGAIGGIGSCWNTPIETVRVLMQRDVSSGLEPKTFMKYVEDIQEEGGVPGLFRGVTPRAVQAIWQTVFMVVVPNLIGM